MKKVNVSVIKGWMARRVNQLLGIDDEVVVDYAFGMLEENVRRQRVLLDDMKWEKMHSS